MARTGATLAEIERVYRERLDELCSVAAAIVGSRDAAKDVVHDAFASLVRRRRSFRGEGPLDAWIWRTVVNTARSHRRRRAAVPVATPAEPSGNGHATEAPADVQLAIALLPERQRLALFLRYYADLEYRTIAAVLGVETGTVAATLHAAHAALRRTLKEAVDA